MEIVVDFDGTLALGDTLDINLMTPNHELIYYINKMYEDGNIIKIVTARGSKSCKTFSERKKKYKNIITKWLHIHNIKYNKISFYKEYGDVYIDDRCFNVNEKIQYNNLSTLFTNNSVKRFSDKVFKVGDPNTIKGEVTWFTHAQKYNIDIPILHSYDINTLSLSFHECLTTYTHDLIGIINILEKFKNLNALNNASIDTYKDRIHNYINNNCISNKEKFHQYVECINIPNTFNHGDFSVNNILQTINKLILIDPIYDENLYQSYYIDIAKFLYSVLFFAKDSKFYELCRSRFTTVFGIDNKQLDILIACESLRVANRKKQLLDITNNLIDIL